jgi:tRNA splicing ligase
MNYKIELSANFKKEAKKLTKKFPSLKQELATLFTALETNPTMGTPLGNDIYKIRLAIASKNNIAVSIKTAIAIVPCNLAFYPMFNVIHCLHVSVFLMLANLIL